MELYRYRGRRRICMAVALGWLILSAHRLNRRRRPRWGRPVFPRRECRGGHANQAGAPKTAATSEPTDLSTIVVTANKRSERLQDVPMAVSALSGSDSSARAR